MKVLLLRHGKTKGNEEHRYIGRTEEGLSELGKKELLRKKEHWEKKEGWDTADRGNHVT